MKQVSSQDIKTLLSDPESNVYLLDIRDPHEYHEKHIPGAINVDLKNIEEVIKDKDARIITYDNHEESQGLGCFCDKLKELGYSNSECLLGGLMGWMEAGGAVESGDES
ncbi:rhodanese-like domain-containing protein [Patescibacteria group bacterium]